MCTAGLCVFFHLLGYRVLLDLTIWQQSFKNLPSSNHEYLSQNDATSMMSPSARIPRERDGCKVGHRSRLQQAGILLLKHPGLALISVDPTVLSLVMIC